MDNGYSGLVQLLNNSSGKPISESEIGTQLQMSPSTIWEQVQILKKQGYDIDFDSNHGFLLKQSPDFLKPEGIQTYLKTNFIGQDLHYFPKLKSVRKEAFHLASQYPEGEESMTPLKRSPHISSDPSAPFAGNGSVLLTELSPKDCFLWSSDYSGINFHAALVLRPGILPARAPQIALVALVALARTIENVSGVRPEISWPNTLLFSEKTLANIHIDMNSNIDKINFLVLTFEVNINGNPEDLDPPLNQKVTSIRKISGKSINRPPFTAALFREIEKWYVTYINKGAEKIIREIGHFFSFDKNESEIVASDKKYTGVIEGLDSDGSLLLRKSSGNVIRIPPGDIPLKATP
jgi:BirA family biotin operon repressor/biotin-[acetyl-CoA-carboxylase] ligase